ncbi:ABC transporter ATP-binding protein [Marinigracilibium pacificum]|uniref:ABC transporter ATP-binding protein n=1 Tax=Marinigracilibium pacificum TaxID=2729599 RepID=A0A848J4W8_9BACT|nr:ABC transporter ATP-binding protein [Marinigracilibium pacificum]NMM49504.1 ABC transporter ATP-binding protein [Marinigracilibium pacificum]
MKESSNDIALLLKDLEIGYKVNHPIAKKINASVNWGENIALVGQNGSGKSTLLKTLSLLQPSLSGSLVIDGIESEKLTENQKAILTGVVLTRGEVIANMRVEDLVMLGRYPFTPWHGRLSKEDLKIVSSSIEATGISYKRKALLSELSDGQLQKAWIARVLAQESKILFLDEPTSFLDQPSKMEIFGLISDLVKTKNKTVITATHDLDLAIQKCHRFWLLNDKGEFIDKLPEELIMNGSINDLFAGKGFEFDLDQGRFIRKNNFNRKYNIKGPGHLVKWVEHALNKYEISENLSEQIVVTENDNKLIFNIGENSYTEMSKFISVLKMRNF